MTADTLQPTRIVPASRGDIFVDGSWVEPHGTGTLEVENPALGSPIATVPRADNRDVDLAVAAARRAFPVWASLEPAERAGHLDRLFVALERRAEEIAQTVSLELGSPIGFSRLVQAGVPISVLRSYVEMAAEPLPEERVGNSLVLREPIGVVAAITPWNYPLYQVMLKVAAALAAGCTAVLKPADLTPLTAYVLFDAVEEAELPRGVVNLVVGSGSIVGEALAAHRDIDAVSFTGSTEVGRRIMHLAADRLARVSLELGGKSANIVLEDADVEAAVAGNLQSLCGNAGQTCSAWSRLLVHRSRLDDALDALATQVRGYEPGDPFDPSTRMGPMASASQVTTVRSYVDGAVSDGATLVSGGANALPDRGHYASPYVFANVDPASALAQEEVFGPVLAVFAFEDDAEAIALANDSPFGLSGAVWSADESRATAVARRVATGQLEINGGSFNIRAPFGGYKQSGLGRELGRWGMEEFLETKSLQY